MAHTLVLQELLAAYEKMPRGTEASYRHLAQVLKTFIQSGAIAAGAPLPAERVLCEMLGLSRVTVRKAIEILIEQGMVSSRQGAGNFVVFRFVEPLTLLASFSEDMRRRGKTAGSIWISREIVWPDSEEAMALAIPQGLKVMRCARVRTADQQPIALEFATVRAAFVGDTTDFGDSLYGALYQHGVIPERAMQRVRAEMIRSDHARLLKTQAATAVFSIERRSFTADGQPVELTKSIYRGDLYDYVVEIGMNAPLQER